MTVDVEVGIAFGGDPTTASRRASLRQVNRYLGALQPRRLLHR